jgi:hypothetical protein
MARSKVIPSTLLVLALGGCSATTEPAGEPDPSAVEGSIETSLQEDPTTPTCSAYCDRLAAACGAVSPYEAPVSCIVACEDWLPGTPDTPDAPDAVSLHARWRAVAAIEADPDSAERLCGCAQPGSCA